MNIEIKKSEKPVKYESAIQLMENRLVDLSKEKTNELIWTLEPVSYTHLTLPTT